MELLTSAQMRAIEQAAIDSGAVTGLALMERAGQGVVEAVMSEWPDLAQTSHKAVVLCGPGNNGGDGFVIARLLKQRGWEVEVFLYGDAEKLPADARVNYERWCEVGEVAPLSARGTPWKSHEADLYVDSLFGTGLTRPLAGELLDYLRWRVCDPEVRERTVSVDMPSGLCADSGRELAQYQETVLADLTVTFHKPKIGHYLDWGPYKSGKLVVVDIGLDDVNVASDLTVEQLVGECDLGNLELRGKHEYGHKFSHGHALILSGPSGRTGAARLAARAALRIGTGLVTVATPHDALTENAAHLTAIMLAEADTPDALTQILKDPRITALCVGPAFGIDRAGAFLPTILKANRATVLDADALTALANDPALFDALHAACVLTPHAGEFKRLFPDIAAALIAPATTGPAYSKVDATRDAAKRAGCVVLFKGPDTVIASPDGRASINASLYERAAPWLATAGSGDVLAGMITGLMARGYSPRLAAETGAYLHVEAALSFGPGLIAEDLPDALPSVFRNLGL